MLHETHQRREFDNGLMIDVRRQSIGASWVYAWARLGSVVKSFRFRRGSVRWDRVISRVKSLFNGVQA